MPAIDLSILNQRQTPAFYADVFANRPAAGFVGRIFVSTNTFAFYRDNGTGWDLIGGPGTGTITGSGSFGSIALWNGTDTITYDVGLTWDGTANSLTASKFIVTGGTSSQFLKGDGSLDSNTYNTGSGAASQVAFFSGTNAITGENNLWWDSTNNHLGINTNTPATALDVNHNGTLIAKFNNTTSANSLVAFENAGNEQWWIGTENTNNDFLFYDATNFPTLSLRTTFKTNGQVLIGGGSTGSGKLVVESATSDNGIQIVGANAPSLRIDSAATGPTKRIGLGISTGVNNFIQGSVDRDMCIFNGSTTASPMLFGIYDTTNVQEAARISAARNFLIGTTTDSGEKLIVNGIAKFTGSYVSFNNNGYIRCDSANWLQLQSGTNGTRIRSSDNSTDYLSISDSNGAATFRTPGNTTGLTIRHFSGTNNPGLFITTTESNKYVTLTASGSSVAGQLLQLGAEGNSGTLNISASNVLIGTTTDAGQKLQVNGTAFISSSTTINSGTLQLSGSGDLLGGTSGSDYGNLTLRGGYAFTTGSATKIEIRGFEDGSTNQGTINLITNNTTRLRVAQNGNVLIGTTTNGASILKIVGLPTSAVGLSSGDIYSNAGILTIVP